MFIEARELKSKKSAPMIGELKLQNFYHSLPSAFKGSQ